MYTRTHEIEKQVYFCLMGAPGSSFVTQTELIRRFFNWPPKEVDSAVVTLIARGIVQSDMHEAGVEMYRVRG